MLNYVEYYGKSLNMVINLIDVTSLIFFQILILAGKFHFFNWAKSYLFYVLQLNIYVIVNSTLGDFTPSDVKKNCCSGPKYCTILRVTPPPPQEGPTETPSPHVY